MSSNDESMQTGDASHAGKRMMTMMFWMFVVLGELVYLSERMLGLHFRNNNWKQTFIAEK